MSKIVVAGSINMDIITRVQSFPLPGETIGGKSVEYLPGGKGLNQAVASANMGAETVLISRLGNDVFAQDLSAFLQKHHINTQYLHPSDKVSGTAFITVTEDGQNTIIVIPGSNTEVSSDDMETLEFDRNDIAVSQFEIPLSAVESFFKKARQSGARTLLNPSPIQTLPSDILELTDILILNETELGFLKGEILTDQTPLPEIIAIAEKLKSRDDQIIIVTLGAKGALVMDKTAILVECPKVCAVDTVGAGDCFTGVTASQLLLGKNIIEAVKIAVKAASLCVTRKGAAPAMPSAKELFA